MGTSNATFFTSTKLNLSYTIYGTHAVMVNGILKSDVVDMDKMTYSTDRKYMSVGKDRPVLSIKIKFKASKN